jgi:hypothetical protein
MHQRRRHGMAWHAPAGLVNNGMVSHLCNSHACARIRTSSVPQAPADGAEMKLAAANRLLTPSQASRVPPAVTSAAAAAAAAAALSVSALMPGAGASCDAAVGGGCCPEPDPDPAAAAAVVGTAPMPTQPVGGIPSGTVAPAATSPLASAASAVAVALHPVHSAPTPTPFLGRPGPPLCCGQAPPARGRPLRPLPLPAAADEGSRPPPPAAPSNSWTGVTSPKRSPAEPRSPDAPPVPPQRSAEPIAGSGEVMNTSTGVWPESSDRINMLLGVMSAPAPPTV